MRKTERRSICIQCGLKSGNLSKCDGSVSIPCSSCKEKNLLCRFKPRGPKARKIFGGGSLRVANRIRMLSDGHSLFSEKSDLEQAKGRVSLIPKWNQGSTGMPKSTFKQVSQLWECLSSHHGVPIPMRTKFPNTIAIEEDSDLDQDLIAPITEERLKLPSFEILDSIHGAGANYFERENPEMMGKLSPGLLIALGILVQELEWDDIPEFHGKYLTAEQVMENGPNIKDLFGIDSLNLEAYDLHDKWTDSIFRKRVMFRIGEDLKFHSSSRQ